MKIELFTVVAILSLAALPAHAAVVPGGVYDCYGRSAVGGRGSNVEGAGLDGRTPYISEGAGGGAVGGSASKFSVVGPNTYLSRGGTTGHFTFDGKTLAMTDGPYKGLKFHKADGFWSFRMLTNTGEEGPVMCPQNLAKDAKAPNKW
jgi:hypothetical protein